MIYRDEKASSSYIYRYIHIIGSASIKKETILGVIGAGLAHVLLHLLETLVVRSSGCWSLKSAHAALLLIIIKTLMMPDMKIFF